jgi:hypothetical protein
MKTSILVLLGALFCPMTVLAAGTTESSCPRGYKLDNNICWMEKESPCKEGFFYSNRLNGCAKCADHATWDKVAQRCQVKDKTSSKNPCKDGGEFDEAKLACVEKVSPPCPERQFYSKKYGTKGACTVCVDGTTWNGSSCE